MRRKSKWFAFSFPLRPLLSLVVVDIHIQDERTQLDVMLSVLSNLCMEGCFVYASKTSLKLSRSNTANLYHGHLTFKENRDDV